MFGRLQKWILIVCLLSISGGQWAIIRTAAWTNMTLKNAENLSTWEAISKTFDGSEPCRICLWLAQEKESEQSPMAFAYSQFLQDGIPQWDVASAVYPPQVKPLFLLNANKLQNLPHGPIKPPPRFPLS